MGAGKIVKEALEQGKTLTKKLSSNIDVQGGIKGIFNEMVEAEQSKLSQVIRGVGKSADLDKVAANVNQRRALGKILNEDDLGKKMDAMKKLRFGEHGAKFGPAQHYAANDTAKALAVSNTKRSASDFGNGVSSGLRDAYETASIGADMARQFYTGGDPARNFKRKATTVAGYAGVNIAGRVLNGGSLTRNNEGERDLAGIPIL